MDTYSDSRAVPEPRSIPSTGDDRPVQSLWAFIWRMTGRHQIGVCLLAAMVAVLSMAPLELHRRIINHAVEAADARALLTLGGVYLAVLLTMGTLKLLLQIYQSWLSESSVHYMRDHLTRLHREKAPDDAEHQEGRSVAVIGTETDQLGSFVGEGISEPVVQGGMVISILGYMFVTEPALAGFAALFMLPQAVTAPLIQRQVNRLLAVRIRLMRTLGDLVANITPGSEARPSQEAMCQQIDGIYTNRMRLYAWKFSGKAATNLINGLAPLAALVGGGYMVIQGDTTLGVVVAFLTGFSRLSEPIVQLIAYYRLAARSRVQHDKIAQWM